MNDLCNTYHVGDNAILLSNIPNNSLDLIYFDPPYNTGRNFFDFDDKYKSIQDYIDFIKVRVVECYRCLKPFGNIVIHIEPKISHYFRFICDEVFGNGQFKNEIVWKTGGNAKNLYQLNRFHDTISVYSKKGKGNFIKMSQVFFKINPIFRWVGKKA